jgi:uncharacterized protein (DUF2267 family)
MDAKELMQVVKTEAGLRSVAEARRATLAALGALRCALDDDDARATARALPDLAWLLDRPASTIVRTAPELYAETQRRERVRPGFAVEHAQAVLQVLARTVDPELVARLRRHLPADIAALVAGRPEPAEPPSHVHVHPARAPEPIQTLSRARPGTAEPIAETRHELAHAGSVARSPAPHGDTMVETARSTRPGREDDTLASTRGDTRRR